MASISIFDAGPGERNGRPATASPDGFELDRSIRNLLQSDELTLPDESQKPAPRIERKPPPRHRVPIHAPEPQAPMPPILSPGVT